MLSPLVAAALVAVSAAEKPKLVVLDLAAPSTGDASLASALTNDVVLEAGRRGIFDVVSSAEVQRLIGLERQKQMLGCAELGNACLTELAGALGARFVLSGSIARVGDAYQLALQTVDSQRAITTGRSVRIAHSFEQLRDAIPYMVAEATGTPLPPPPSRLLPYSMIAGGGLLVLSGGVLGLLALSNEHNINLELARGLQDRQVLKTYPTYRSEAALAAGEKTSAVIAMAVGAALLAGGIWLNPPDFSSGGMHASIAVTSSGIALAGVLP